MNSPRLKQRLAAMVLCVVISTGSSARAQEQGAGASPHYPNKLGSDLVRNLIADQRAIWSAPARVRLHDFTWLAPFGAVTAGLIASDRDASRTFIGHPNLVRRSRTISNLGLLSIGAGSGGMYLLGRLRSSEHQRETGLLMGESMLDSLAVAEGLKLVTQRPRPEERDQNGRFWDGGSSFPSSHSIVAWSGATVLAHEYPGPLTKVFAYGGASAISLARVTGRKHFPSDVVVGSTLGYLIGRHVYRAHHDRELNGASWGTFEQDEKASVLTRGSAYVPLDNWAYDAFDRLAALGYIRTSFPAMRPWARSECIRLLEEAEESIVENDAVPPHVRALYSALQQEFKADETLEHRAYAEVERVYARVTGIAGTPLRDAYHFAQTIYNDNGRPYGEGLNAYVGTEVRAAAGPLTLFVSGELQQAGRLPALSASAIDTIRLRDAVPQVNGGPFPSTTRGRLLDAYVGFRVLGYQITAGQQSLWWGPGRGGALSFTNNAEPLRMVRVENPSPFEMPSLLRFLGPVRTQFFFGRLQGHRFVILKSKAFPNGFEYRDVTSSSQPWIHGEKVSFQPTRNLQFGFSVTTVFGGPGFPLTARTIARSFGTSNTLPGEPDDPGDRRAGFDFSYRIPGLRNRVLLYSDSMAEDEFSPVAYPRRSAFNPGIYISQLPGLSKVDLRVEGVYTDVPNMRGPGVHYFNAHYLNGYTNNGQLMAHWIGREARGIQGASTIWLSPRSRVQLLYRGEQVSAGFIDGGGRLQDFGANAEFPVREKISMKTSAQFEQWRFPVLAPERKQNLVVSFTLEFRPSWRLQ